MADISMAEVQAGCSLVVLKTASLIIKVANAGQVKKYYCFIRPVYLSYHQHFYPFIFVVDTQLSPDENSPSYAKTPGRPVLQKAGILLKRLPHILRS